MGDDPKKHIGRVRDGAREGAMPQEDELMSPSLLEATGTRAFPFKKLELGMYCLNFRGVM